MQRQPQTISMLAWWLVLATTLLLLISAWAQPQACSEAGGGLGYCSVGKVQPFRGDLAKPGAVAECLKARNYKKEIFMTMVSGTRVSQAVQLLSNFYGMGYAHSVLLVDNETSCGLVPRELAHLAEGCAWYTLDYLPPLIKPVWHKRLRFVALAVRHGYNVLHLDSDISAFTDPYIHFKTNPQISTFNLICQIDPFGWWGINSGLFYVQNARPDGPVAWAMAEVADRMLRIMEDPSLVYQEFPWVKELGQLAGVINDDQTHLRDTVLSILVGRPVFDWVIPRPPGADFKVHENIYKLPRQEARVTIPIPYNWHLSQRHYSDYAMNYNVTMPNCKGTFPKELGGKLLAPRGNLSLPFLEELMAAPYPLWPDPYDGTQAERAAAIPMERYSFGPDWLFASWPARGMDGLWDPVWTEGHPEQVVGHMLMGAGDYQMAKTLVQQGVGTFNWTLERLVLGHEPLWAYTEEDPEPRLLAYHPELMLRLRPDEIEDFQFLIMRLLQAARLLNRTLVWPIVRCDARCVPHDPEIRQQRSDRWPFRYNNDFYAFGLLSSRPPGPAMCMWGYYIFKDCLERNRGVTALELKYLTEERQQQGYHPPGADNTLFALHGRDVVQPRDYGEGGVSGLLHGMVLEDGDVLVHEGPNAKLHASRDDNGKLNPDVVARAFPAALKVTPEQLRLAAARAAAEAPGRDRVLYLASVPELEPSANEGQGQAGGAPSVWDMLPLSCDALSQKMVERYKDWYWREDGSV